MKETHKAERQFVIIGAGPAGLTAAHELTKLGLRPIVFEKEDKVGGIARTENYKGFLFDMGGHRFFTKVEEVKKLWHEILGDDFLRRPRLSQIYYNHKFFYYPLKPFNVLVDFGFRESFCVILSYLKWHLFPYRPEDTFEQWVTNRFGKRLFLIFFKTYTEKVWGISCSELKAEWADQRIKDLSLKTALLNMFLKPKTTVKTLIQEFDYPRYGPGMMWNAFKEEVERRGGTVRLNYDTIRIHRKGNVIDSVGVSWNGNGQEEVIKGTDFISSIPVTEFIKRLDPPAPPEVLQAVEKLRYRDFLTVCLIVNKPDLFPDNWIYIHDPGVKVARIQNFKNWSPDMVPNPAKTSLGLEYFCTEGDEMWNTPDADLIELGKREVEQVGLARYEDVEDGCVFRVPKAYPIYDSNYRDCLVPIQRFLDSLENFQTIGRNGLHRYDNQDRAMLTGMLAVRNLMLGERHNLWSINADQEYCEETREVIKVIQTSLSRVFLKLDRTAFGLSLGTAAGLLLFLATLWLMLNGGGVVGPHLQLLSHYFPGYSVTVSGSAVGLAYGFVAGFVSGWGVALLRNLVVFLSMARIHRRAEWPLLRELFDHL